MGQILLLENKTIITYVSSMASANYMHMYSREFSATSSGIYCAGGKGHDFTKNTYYDADNVIVPLVIYGIKGVQ